jgi:hypothetical protein
LEAYRCYREDCQVRSSDFARLPKVACLSVPLVVFTQPFCGEKRKVSRALKPTCTVIRSQWCTTNIARISRRNYAGLVIHPIWLLPGTISLHNTNSFNRQAMCRTYEAIGQSHQVQWCTANIVRIIRYDYQTFLFQRLSEPPVPLTTLFRTSNKHRDRLLETPGPSFSYRFCQPV